MLAAPPPTFSGLLFAPSEENAVYLLLGLLWRHLPIQLVFESFETDPELAKYGHTKWLDARGKVFKGGEWRDVAIEFKYCSSGFRGDVKKHAGVTADILICWEHDAADVGKYFSEVVELRRVFWNLPEEERKKLIWKPDVPGKLRRSRYSIEDLVHRFSPEGQKKLQRMIDYWEAVVAGKCELKFFAGNRVAVRVSKYAKERLLVMSPFAEELQDLMVKLQGRTVKNGVSFSMGSLSIDEIAGILSNIRELSRRL